MVKDFHQRSWYTFGGQESVETGADEAKTIPVLPQRAGQVPHLWGYRFGCNIEQSELFNASGEGWDIAMMLRAGGEDIPSQSPRVLIASLASNAFERHVIDFVHFERSALTVLTAVGVASGKNVFMSEWIHCDLQVPAVFATYAMRNDIGSQTLLRAWGMVDYTWDNVSDGEYSALLLQWGRDPQDYVLGNRVSTA